MLWTMKCNTQKKQLLSDDDATQTDTHNTQLSCNYYVQRITDPVICLIIHLYLLQLIISKRLNDSHPTLKW